MQARYYVYRNLHTNTFSLKYKDRVIDHPTELILTDVKFSVSQAGRQKVLQTKRKNVHATVNGFPTDLFYYKILAEVKYDPYKQMYFEVNNKPIYSAEYVLCKDNKIYLLTDII